MMTPVSLSSLLQRAQLRVALVALLAVGAVLTLASVAYLRSTTLRNLELVGRSIAYSAEAAVVFRDADASLELLHQIVEREGLSAARIVLGGGQTLATYRRARPPGWQLQLSERLFAIGARSVIEVEGRSLAQVEVEGDGTVFLSLLGWCMAGVALGMLLTALGIRLVSRRLEHSIVAPLRALSAHTRAVREQRAYARRLPPAAVSEIDALSADFNALLAEVQAHEAELLRHQEALRTDNDSLSFQAQHDALTGACSRAYFEECLADAVTRAGQRGGRVGLLFIDADKFKRVNDEHGHEIGDRLLCVLAERLRAGVRESDLVGRLGGDEFVVLIDPLRHAEDAQRVAEQVQQSVRQGRVQLASGEELRPGISVGVAIYPDDGADADALLRYADVEMYRHKLRQRGNDPARV
ncbi:diguanylate cyclase [Paucibacter sediminis]|uniref:Diguanylate cyclase n=1 Tax=Paucibacter sediminis TaxID=3019553 RepID=A0AA95NB71_9BURK|nr:sensor domain-containing diguanylate cyclase [Paucibacter sp. S2-9]WIT10809.1 diguanylate cyclase [Paucibacter sp. S2-9]